MLKSGIIKDNEVIEIEDSKILSFLQNLLNQSSEEEQNSFNLYDGCVIMEGRLTPIGYFVDMKGFVIVHEGIVYYPEDLKEGIIDKIEYVQNGYTLVKKLKKEVNNNRIVQFKDQIAAEIERIGFKALKMICLFGILKQVI